MNLNHLLAAASAVALVGGAAYAQDVGQDAAMTPAPEGAMSAGADASMTDSQTMPSGVVNPAADVGVDASASAPSDDAMAPSAAQSGADAASVVQPRIIANAPIPDTEENREMYGDPLSNAGKRSAAKGN